MITEFNFIKLALSFPGVETTIHFKRTGVRVAGRRMFATYLADDNTANVFLTRTEQQLFCTMDKANVYPVANSWGEKGATTFKLDSIEQTILQEALYSAYKNTLPLKGKG